MLSEDKKRRNKSQNIRKEEPYSKSTARFNNKVKESESEWFESLRLLL